MLKLKNKNEILFFRGLLKELPSCADEIIPTTQRTNGPVNAHLICGTGISTKHTEPGKAEKFDLAVKVNHGSAFEQLMMGPSPQCYIPNFVETGFRFRRGRFLKFFYHVWSWRPSWSCDQHHVHFLVPKSLHTKPWLQMAQWFLKKASFNFHI